MDTEKAIISPNIRTSSWKDPYFSKLFYNLVRTEKPYLCVELGTFAGYSAFCTATALRDNGLGELDCYDMWELYPYNHVPMKEAESNLVNLPVRLFQENAFNAHTHYEDGSVDYLLFDISNDGEVYKTILKNWYSKLSNGAVVVAEGGIPERDQIEWMVKYNKEPIASALKDPWVLDHYDYAVIGTFPSVTIFRRYDDRPV